MMMRRMTGAILAIAGMAGLAACGQSEAATTPDRKARGKYLVHAMGCNDCHTPWKMGPKGPEPDMTRFLSGHPERERMPEVALGEGQWAASGGMTEFQGPWGRSFAANLTPDVNTGLGIWTEDMFLRAIREGKHMGQSRPIMPPMPWPAFRNLNDEDLKSIFAFLRSLPPMHNRVPEYEPPAVKEE